MEPEAEGANTRQTRTSNKGKSRVLFRLSDDERDDLAEIARSSPNPHERREAEEALEEDDIARAEEEAAAKNTPGRLALARRRASSTPDAPDAPGQTTPAWAASPASYSPWIRLRVMSRFARFVAAMICFALSRRSTRFGALVTAQSAL